MPLSKCTDPRGYFYKNGLIKANTRDEHVYDDEDDNPHTDVSKCQNQIEATFV